MLPRKSTKARCGRWTTMTTGTRPRMGCGTTPMTTSWRRASGTRRCPRRRGTPSLTSRRFLNLSLNQSPNPLHLSLKPNPNLPNLSSSSRNLRNRMDRNLLSSRSSNLLPNSKQGLEVCLEV